MLHCNQCQSTLLVADEIPSQLDGKPGYTCQECGRKMQPYRSTRLLVGYMTAGLLGLAINAILEIASLLRGDNWWSGRIAYTLLFVVSLSVFVAAISGLIGRPHHDGIGAPVVSSGSDRTDQDKTTGSN